jgi:hypothetical protein
VYELVNRVSALHRLIFYYLHGGQLARGS